MQKFRRVVVIAPTRSTCLNISVVLENGAIPPTLLMQERGKEIFEAVDQLNGGGFGVVAGTGTGKTVAIRDIAKRILGENLQVDIITRENEATDYTWTRNVLVVTPGVALHWLKSEIITKDDLVVIDEIHQTSEHLEISMALAKRHIDIFVWMSATIDPAAYAQYLKASTVIQCAAFDPARKAKVFVEREEIGCFLDRKVGDFIARKRAVAVFVPTRAMTESLARKYGERGIYCDFYHGGEKAEKLRQFLKGDIPIPFMIFMTVAGASSLTIAHLNTVVIVNEMYKEVVHNDVKVLEKVELDNNMLLQMGGRVNGRALDGEIFIISQRSIDFHALRPTAPQFVLGSDLRNVALICARVGVDISDLKVVANIDHGKYQIEVGRFKNRGIISKNGELTDYGRQVERLPVVPAWAEVLVKAQETKNEELADIAIVCSSVISLYSLTRKEGNLSEVMVSGSDHLTGYNIVASALKQFGCIRHDDDGMNYAFRGDYVRKSGDETEKGAFIAWCDQNGFSGKAIKEVVIAMKSVYRQLGIELLAPEDFSLVKVNSEIHNQFVELLARTQSLDFVHDEHNSQAGTVQAAQHSTVYGRWLLGIIRHWADKRGIQRASIEGTEIPKEMLKKYASINQAGHGMIFAGEKVYIPSDGDYGF